MPTETDLLAGLVAHPHEAERWLILADWLEDQGDPRAELARLRWQLQHEPDHPDCLPRQERQCELLHGGLRPVAPRFTNTLGMTFALIPAGTFFMGSPDAEPHHEADEIRHRVTLSRPFFLGVYPVTVGEFAAFVAATGHRTDAERDQRGYALQNDSWVQDPAVWWRELGFAQTDRHPVAAVTWNDAQAFLAWLNQVEAGTGRAYVLPTEAQWEYACRAGTTTPYFWGHDQSWIDNYAWYKENSGFTTHAVETQHPNAWGLWHMIGNVWEWGRDHRTAYDSADQVDPVGIEGTYTHYVLRGGGWHVVANHCRSACRYGRGGSDVFTDFGFRVAVTLGG